MLLQAGYADGYRLLHHDPGYSFPTWEPAVRLDYLLVPAKVIPAVKSCRVVYDAPGVKEARTTSRCSPRSRWRDRIAAVDRYPLGLNTYCLRAFRWPDLKLLDYAASLKLDAVFLQDSLDPAHERSGALARSRRTPPSAWPAPGDRHRRVAAPRPRRHSAVGETAARRREARRRHGLADRPHARRERSRAPAARPGREASSTPWSRLLRAVRTEAMDAGLKFAIENHKDLLCWETRQIIEAAGKEFVGSYLDTGNPVFVMEDPMETVETLGPVAVTFHLRDSVIYETRNGIAVQWVPLGEGVVDFKKIVAQGADALPRFTSTSSRSPAVRRSLAYLDPDFMQQLAGRESVHAGAFPRAGEERPSVRARHGDRGCRRATPAEPYAAALQYQQKEHMERSVEYGKKVLDLGIKWRA